MSKIHKKGRGSQINPKNRFERYKVEVEEEYLNYLDKEHELSVIENVQSKFIEVFPKKIINEVKSKDIPFGYSMNPYQGCEHGCSYCYARETHEYWGYSSGTDFEQTILVKKTAPKILKETLSNKKWKAMPIMLSGNTDCYQPIERKLNVTRALIQLLVQCNHPVSIITKNALILRDLDVLRELSEKRLVKVSISITTLDDTLRNKLEPRTSSVKNKLKTIEILSNNNIPVNIMMAPIIPGLTDEEIMEMAKVTSELGALNFNYTILRTNGPIEHIFRNWLEQHFPDKMKKIVHLTQQVHSGNMENRNQTTRMSGTGIYAKHIKRIVELARAKYFHDREMPTLETDKFKPFSDQLSLEI